MIADVSTELLQVPPAKIVWHPNNPRRDVGDVTELADSMRSVGVMEPLVVAPSGVAKTPWLLIAGHRRHAAAKTAGLKTVPVVTRPDLDTPARQLEAMLVENLHRADLSPVEEADAYQLLLDFPRYTPAKVAKAVGRSLATVRERLKLGKVPEGARARVHDGTLSITDALVFQEFADDPRALKALEQAEGTGNWRWTVQRLRDDRKAAHEIAAARADLEAAGVRVVDRPNGFPWRSVEKVLGTRPGELPIRVEEHTDCPHHAAIVDSAGYGFGPVVYVCTDPTVHAEHTTDDDPPSSPTQAQAATDALADRERERLAADLRTAAGLRAAFLRERLDGFVRLDELQRQAIRRALLVMAATAAVEVDVQDWTAWLGLPDCEGDPDPYDACEAQLVAAIADRDPDVLTLAALAANAESHLTTTWAYTSHEPWFALLQELGYELSAFERELLPPAGDAEVSP